MNIWFLAVLGSAVSVAAVFVAHDLPPNKNYIEPRMAQGKSFSYVLGFAYYVLLCVPAMLPFVWLVKS